MIFIETQRLYLRNIMPDDAAEMFDYRNNKFCPRYKSLGYVPSLSSPAFGRWIKASMEEEFAMLSR